MGFVLITLALILAGVAVVSIRGAGKEFRFIAVTSFLVVWVSPFFTPATVHEPGELAGVRFGGPIRFMEQHPTLTPPDEAFPLHFTRLLNPQEHPTTILWGRFVLSMLLVAGLLWGAQGIIRLIRRAATGIRL
ncbi:MAG TPA: hypothetical protein VGK74_07370 [Symbiobacteriaceae bacterium]